jgi:hypothetical protein
MRFYIALALIAGATPAFAEQPSQPEIQQTLGKKLMSKIDAGLACSAQAIATQKELENVKAELKALKEKYEAPAQPQPPA